MSDTLVAVSASSWISDRQENASLRAIDPPDFESGGGGAVEYSEGDFDEAVLNTESVCSDCSREGMSRAEKYEPSSLGSVAVV